MYREAWQATVHWGRRVVHYLATAAAAKSLQSCPTLCDPIDGSPPGSPVPGILQVLSSGQPQDWKRSVFIPIPKKDNAKECSNYRTTALISHTSKVMLNILQARLQQYVNHELSDVQAGFRKGRGTRDQIANIRWIMEKAREFQKNIYFCFIDYAKAFDCVDQNKLWKTLKEMGVPDHVTCLLRNLYAGQEATVRTGHGTTDWFQIGKGVRQGCIFSPCLFNLYSEYIWRRQWHPTPALLPGKSHGWRSLVGRSPWGC